MNLYVGTLITKDVFKYGDIGLHISIHPSGCYSVINWRINRVWGREDRTPRGRLPRPLLQNQKFRLSIVVDESCFNVEINDRHFVSLQHRVPFNQIGLVNYSGDASIDNVEVVKSAPPPYAMPPLLPAPSEGQFDTSTDRVLYNVPYPRLPLLQPIKCGLHPGMTITITARTRDNRFDVGLYQGPNPYEDPSSDVALHMEVYIKEMCVLRNSHQVGQWRNSEKHLEQFPFFVNVEFRMIIRVESNRYMVSVNGRHLFDFYHRVLPLNTIDHLCIHGGLEIMSVCIMSPSS